MKVLALSIAALATLVAVAARPGTARADTVGPAPPPTPLTCKATPDCPGEALCQGGACMVPDQQSKKNLDDARVHFEQGNALFDSGDFTGALAEYQESYTLNPVPAVLKNIGLCLKSLFRYGEAIDTLQRYLDESRGFSASSGDPAQTQQIIVEMKALLADVTVTVSPANAAVTVDGRPATVVAGQPLRIAAGTHSLEVAADGFAPQKRDVMVSAGVAMALDFHLVLIPKTAKITITSPVPRAAVSIDGKAVGSAPLEVELEGGGHSLEVAAPKYRTHRSELVVTPGQPREVNIDLDKDIVVARPWYRNPYVLGGAAIVVVGATLGIAYSIHQSPVDGTLGTGSLP